MSKNTIVKSVVVVPSEEAELPKETSKFGRTTSTSTASRSSSEDSTKENIPVNLPPAPKAPKRKYNKKVQKVPPTPTSLRRSCRGKMNRQDEKDKFYKLLDDTDQMLDTVQPSSKHFEHQLNYVKFLQSSIKTIVTTGGIRRLEDN